jgi:hypothetical protein
MTAVPPLLTVQAHCTIHSSPTRSNSIGFPDNVGGRLRLLAFLRFHLSSSEGNFRWVQQSAGLSLARTALSTSASLLSFVKADHLFIALIIVKSSFPVKQILSESSRSIISASYSFISHSGLQASFPFRVFPGAQRLVHLQIFLRNRVCSENHLNPVTAFEKCLKRVDIGTGRIAHQKPSCEVDHLNTVPNHFITCIFNIPARAAVAGRVAHQRQIIIFITAESALSLPHRSKTFSPSAGAIAVTDDYPNIYFLAQSYSPNLMVWNVEN